MRNTTAMASRPRKYILNNDVTARASENMLTQLLPLPAIVQQPATAGAAIADRLRSRIQSLSAATKRQSEGICLLLTAEGAMKDEQDVLETMREIAERAAYSLVPPCDVAVFDRQFRKLLKELDAIADNTSYAGRRLLDGTCSHAVSSECKVPTLCLPCTSAAGLGVGELGLENQQRASTACILLDSAIRSLDAYRAALASARRQLDREISDTRASFGSLTRC